MHRNIVSELLFRPKKPIPFKGAEPKNLFRGCFLPPMVFSPNQNQAPLKKLIKISASVTKCSENKGKCLPILDADLLPKL